MDTVANNPPPPADNTDPFLQAQHDVLNLLSTTKPLLTSYLRIRRTSPSPTSPELLESRRELESALRDLSSDLQDLADAVRAVEDDPYRWGLDVAEVARRRRLVDEVQAEVATMRDESRAAAATTSLPDPKIFDADDEAGGGDDGEDYAAGFEAERQQEMLAEQDQALDGVFRTVGNLRRQADTMGRELEEQGELLDQTDVLADRMGGKLQTGLKRVGWVVRQNEDKWSGCCIGVLIVVLIILLLLVLLI